MKQKILIVEDEAQMCDLLMSFFGDKGYKVTAVQNGEDAIARLEGEDFALVITHIKLPGMSGLGLPARLRQDWQDVAGIIITAVISHSFTVRAHKHRGA